MPDAPLSSDERFKPGSWDAIEDMCGWRVGHITKPPSDLAGTSRLMQLKRRYDMYQRQLADDIQAYRDAMKLREFYKRQGLL